MSVTPLIQPSDVFTWALQSTASPPVSPSAQIQTVVEEICEGITSYVYWRTGRQPGYFTDAPTYTEVRNGNGSSVLYVLNGPINTANLDEVTVQVANVTIPQSTTWGQGGWFVQQDGNSFGLRPGQSLTQTPNWPFGRQYRFYSGIGNVSLTYPGGYSEVPYDLFMGCLQAAAVLLDRRLREDEGSRGTPQTGSVTGYRSWAYPPGFNKILKNYERTAMVMG